MPHSENTRARTARDLGRLLEERTVVLTLSADLHEYLQTVAQGTGQTVDDLVSDRFEDFKRLWEGFE